MAHAFRPMEAIRQCGYTIYHFAQRAFAACIAYAYLFMHMKREMQYDIGNDTHRERYWDGANDKNNERIAFILHALARRPSDPIIIKKADKIACTYSIFVIGSAPVQPAPLMIAFMTMKTLHHPKHASRRECLCVWVSALLLCALSMAWKRCPINISQLKFNGHFSDNEMASIYQMKYAPMRQHCFSFFYKKKKQTKNQ